MHYSQDYDHESWFHSIFRPNELKRLTQQAVPMLKAFMEHTPFEAIAFSGLSGALFASVLSNELQVPMVMIRKEYECNGTSGHKRRASGYRGFKSFIILDDLVSSGGTLKRIYDQARKFAKEPDAELVGIAMYDAFYATDSVSAHRSPTGEVVPTIPLWKEGFRNPKPPSNQNIDQDIDQDQITMNEEWTKRTLATF